MVAYQRVPDNFPITKESLSDLIGRAFWWGENKGPVILFCGLILAQALMDFELDEFWVDILQFPDEPLNEELVYIGDEKMDLLPEIDEKIYLCVDRQETLDKLLKST